MNASTRWILGVTLAAPLLIASANTDEKRSHDPMQFAAQYRTACGPIACFVSLYSLGFEVSLEELARACKWKEGELTTLRAMNEMLNRTRGVSCTPCKLSPSELKTLLQSGSCRAIIAVRQTVNGPIEHALAVVSTVDAGFVVVDYPGLARSISADDLADLWDGQTLVVSVTQPASAFIVAVCLTTALATLAMAVLVVCSRVWTKRI